MALGAIPGYGPVTMKLTLWYISELDPYSLQTYRMSKYGLPTSRLSKVIVWHRYRQTDRYGT